MSAYLTEKKLGIILNELFGSENVFPQIKIAGHKVDYVLKLKFPTGIQRVDNKIIEAEAAYEVSEEYCVKDGEIIQFCIEYDGHYHYNSNKQVHFDMTFNGYNQFSVDWIERECHSYILRIPYWIQLTADITEFLFGKPIDFSDKFPHGFISPKCVLPEVFCVAGEARFVSELLSLPESVRNDVIKSLFVKAEAKTAPGVASKSLWINIFKMHKEYMSFYNSLRKLFKAYHQDENTSYHEVIDTIYEKYGEIIEANSALSYILGDFLEEIASETRIEYEEKKNGI